MDFKYGSFGKFVRWEDFSHMHVKCNPCVGLVTNAYGMGDRVHEWVVQVAMLCDVRHRTSLETSAFTLPYDQLEIEDKDIALNHYRATVRSMDAEIEKGGLEAAILARKQFFISEVVKKLEEAHDERALADAITSKPPAPGTGQYVVAGWYNPTGISTGNLEVVRITPDVDESVVEGLLLRLRPKGLGSIPAELPVELPTKAQLTGYIVYEIPREFLASDKLMASLAGINTALNVELTELPDYKY